MTLKKKIEIAAILCSIGICSFGQNVFAGEFLRLPAQTNAKVEQVVQTRLLEEQRAYLMQAQLMTKVNLEQQIKDKPVYIPKTKHVVTQRERSILERIVEGKGEMSDLDELEELATMVQSMALCGLGKSAPLPVISTLKRFRDEYEEHIKDKKCRAKVCTALRKFHINPEFCIGCGKCAKNCPAGAISGKIKSPYHINNDVCIKCGSCKDNCNFDAVYVEA